MTTHLTHLAQLLHETSHLHNLLTNLYNQPTLTSPHGHANTATWLTQQEKYAIIRERITTYWAELERIAWAWQVARGERHVEMDEATYLAAHLDWAARSYEDLAMLEASVKTVHRAYQRLAGETDQVSAHLCPLCGQAQLRHRDTDNIYYCPACEGSWTPAQLQALRHYRITTAGEWLTVKEAAQKYQIPTKTLYTWIRRGKLTRQGKRVNSAQLEFLC